MEVGAKVRELFEKASWVGRHRGGASWRDISELSPALATVEKEGRRIFGLSSWSDDAVSRGREGAVWCWTIGRTLSC